MESIPPVTNLMRRLGEMVVNVRQALEEDQLDWALRPEEGEWSITEVICHLRDVEREVHQHRFRALIAQENAFIHGVSADEWATARQYSNQDGRFALAEYIAARKITIEMLTPLDEAMWSRQGRHAFFGQTSMHELLHLVVRHDELHWEQLTALIALQTEDDKSFPD